jgi:CxxC-x17-CxxC domain-containing protein
MSFSRKSIRCCDCGTSFTINSEEQRSYASRDCSSEQIRCSWCRAVRKTELYKDGDYSYRLRPEKQMFHATCTQCGKDTRLPFEPRFGRPVYCSNCFSKVRPGR